MTVMTRREMDDLLGLPSGPMIPPDEASAGGRPDDFRFPKGTYNDVREFPPGGALVNRPNAYNTGRVKVLTPENPIRDMPADGGTVYDAQRERMMSYRTRAEAYKFIPYGQAKPVIGPPMWPAKQLFPYNPTVKQVDQTEHDIVPPESANSRRDSVVRPVDGDDSKRGFSPAQETKGDLAMLYGMGEEFFDYGGPTVDTESGVNEHDLLTLVDWDDQKNDWQLNGLGAHAASKVAAKIASAAVAVAQKGGFKSLADAVAWMRSRAAAIRIKRIAKLEKAIKVATEEAIKIASPQIAKILAKGGVADYLSDDSLSAFNFRRGRGFNWGQMRRAMPGKRKGFIKRLAGLFGIGDGGSEYPEYADNQDTSGWNTESNDTFAYIPNLGGLGADDDWQKSLVTSLDSPAGQAVTSAATGAVKEAIATGQVSTTEQIASAVQTAAKIAADVYAAKLMSKVPAPTKPSILSTVTTTVLAPDQPLWKRPLFWIGAALLVGGGGFMLLKGGKKGGTRRRSRRNALLPQYTAYSNRAKARRWKSRWA